MPLLAILLSCRDVATPAIIGAIACIAILSSVRLQWRALIAGACVVLLSVIWTTIVFTLLTNDDTVKHAPIVIDGWITLHEEALRIGASTAMRMAAMVAIALLGSLGTTPRQLISALVRQCRIPYRLAYGAIVAVRFVPRYHQDLLTLRAAQLSRGIIHSSGLISYLCRDVRLILPLLAGGIRHADRLSLVMDARGFGAHQSRSDRQPALLRYFDIAFVLVVWSAGIGSMFAADYL